MTPVSIQKDNLICINVKTNFVWISKDGPPSPTGLNALPEMKDRYCPTGSISKARNAVHAETLALNLAYVVAWIAGLGIKNVTSLYPHKQDIFIFQAMQG